MVQDHSDHNASKGTDKSTLVTDSSVRLMYHDPSDLVSLILIYVNPNEGILSSSSMLVLLMVILGRSAIVIKC